MLCRCGAERARASEAGETTKVQMVALTEIYDAGRIRYSVASLALNPSNAAPAAGSPVSAYRPATAERIAWMPR